MPIKAADPVALIVELSCCAGWLVVASATMLAFYRRWPLVRLIRN